MGGWRSRPPRDFQQRVLGLLELHTEALAQHTGFLVAINRKADKLMATQEDVDAALAALVDDETGLDASVSRIEAEIAALSNQGVNVDALLAEVGNLKGHVDTVASIAPEAPPAP